MSTLDGGDANEAEVVPTLTTHIVCYADILGYVQESKRALVEGRGDAYLQKLRSTLNDAYARIRDRQQAWSGGKLFEVKVFTDNIVLAYPIREAWFTFGESELGHVLEILGEFQLSLAMAGYFIRGGIAYGQHYMDDDIVFGDALLDAVELDKAGGPPRLALTSAATQTVRRHLGFYRSSKEAPHITDLLQDADGRVFVNYLQAAFEFAEEAGIDFEVIDRHRAAVCQGLSEFRGSPGIRSKFEWAARYHNYVCRAFMERHPICQYASEDSDEIAGAVAGEAQKLSDHMIDESELQVFPGPLALEPIPVGSR
jgi:hypothetical protein